MSQATNILEDAHVDLCDADANLTSSQGLAPHLEIICCQQALNSLSRARQKIEQATILIEKHIYEPTPAKAVSDQQ